MTRTATRRYRPLTRYSIRQAVYRCQAGAWRDGERLQPGRRTEAQEARIALWVEAIIRLHAIDCTVE